MFESIDGLLGQPQFTFTKMDRERVLLPLLQELIVFHSQASQVYGRVVESQALPNPEKTGMAMLPYLPVRVFKELDLRSVASDKVSKTLTSSGTTGQQVSRIFLDDASATRQQAALASVMTTVLGPDRLPMLIVDTKSIISNRTTFSARAAGVLGMMNFGRAHTWLLDEDMNLNKALLTEFLDKHGKQPFLIFGFTFMAWKYLLQAVMPGEFDLSNAILVHSGGWKKLQDEAVDNEEFNHRWLESTGLSRTRNFYGMVEQIGSIFVEGDDGWLYCPNYADVIIRNPLDWSLCEQGEIGVIQVISALPTSYPGNVLLTEDLGLLGPECSEGPWRGPRLKVLGRLPKAELRGCSDTHASQVGAA